MKIHNNKEKLIVILGPTASGKTKLAVEMARRFDGEIVSADSRQVYRGMDIGTGKDLAEYEEIKHHLIDVADPQTQFNVAEFKRRADAAIIDIAKRGRLPLLVGGSGMYIQAVVDNFSLDEVLGVDEDLRAELEAKSVRTLFEMLKIKNGNFAERLDESDKKNKRRLIRYLEIEMQGAGKTKSDKPERKYEVLVIGLLPDQELMEKKIRNRLIERLEKEDMVNEVEGLIKSGVSIKRLKEFGLEYKFIAEYLEEECNYQEMVERLFIAIRQFAKRQLTWFRRWEKQGQNIAWLEVGDKEEADQLIKDFLS